MAELLRQTQPSKQEPPAPYPLTHVAIIMDGNRRWADKKFMPRTLGHQEGVKTLKTLVKHATRRQLKYMTVYAFSSENWNRSKDEVGYLIDLFARVLRDELEELAENELRLKFIGDFAKFPADLQRSLKDAEERTKNNTRLSLQVALNYGSRLELTQAVQQIIKDVQAGKIAEKDITEKTIDNYLYTASIPDPDLIIRTGGEMRLSNYLLWQAAYSEIFVTPTLWPDFNAQEFDQAIEEFAQRQRRWGGD